MLSPYLIGQLSGNASKAGDFLTLSGNALALPSYTSLPTSGGTNTTLYSAASTLTLTGAVSAGSLKLGTSAASGTIATLPGKALTIGDGVNTAGVILNSGSKITGTTVGPTFTVGSAILASNTVFYADGTSDLTNVILSGAGGMTLLGPGTYSLAGFAAGGGNTYTGQTVIGSTVNFTGQGFTAGGATPFGAEPSTLATNSVVLLDGANLQVDVATFTANRGFVLAGGTVTLGNGSTGRAWVINGPISGYANNLIISGSGTGNGLTLGSSTSSFIANSITIAPGGFLNVQSDLALGAVPATVNPTAIVLNGGKLQLSNGATTPVLNSNRGIYLDANGGTIAEGNGVTLTMGSVISGVGALTLQPSSNSGLILAATNTYLGGTNVQGGTSGILNISSNANLGDPTGPLALGGVNLGIVNTAATGFTTARNITLTNSFVTITTAAVGSWNSPDRSADPTRSKSTAAPEHTSPGRIISPGSP